MSGLSVIIPTFNRIKYLRDAVTSVLEQTVAPQEILIINDASSDDFKLTIEKIASLSSLIKLITNETQKGVAYSRNRGLEQAKGEYITFLDDDDLLESDFIEKGLGEFSGDEKIEGIISQIELVETDDQNSDYHRMKKLMQGTSNSSEEITTNFLLIHCPMVHSFMFRKSAVNGFRFPEDLKYGEDMYLWIQMVDSGINFKKVNWVGGYFRLHETNASSIIEVVEKIRFCDKLMSFGLVTDKDSKHLIALRGFYWSLKNGTFSAKYFWWLVKHPFLSLKAIYSRFTTVFFL